MRTLAAPLRPAHWRVAVLTTRMAIVALGIAVTACGEHDGSAKSALSASAASSAPTVAAPPTAPSLMSAQGGPAAGRTREIAADQSSAGVAADAFAAARPAPAQNAIPTAPSSMVIRSGSAFVEVDSLERAIAALQRTALAIGGYVGNTAISLGDNQIRTATIELKIPATRYDAAVAGLTPLGKVESVTSNAEDVGEEFVDLTARIANAKRLELRLIALLDNRTGRLQDALAVEREMARVREEIERIEGRARYLASRVAISTLIVSLHERAPLVAANPGENILLDAVKDAWRNFVRFIAALIASLGVLVPVGVLAALALAAWKRWQRAGRITRAPR